MIRTNLTSTVAALAVLHAAAARAESVPEFSLPYALEKATHIVVVDQAGKVVERWRGNLKVGQELEFKAAEKPQAVVEVPGVLQSKIKQVTGQRRVLFLIKDGGGRGLDRRPTRFVPAGFLKAEIALATIWIEGEECFAIYQWMNPGPGAHLHPLNMTEQQLRAQVKGESKPTK